MCECEDVQCYHANHSSLLDIFKVVLWHVVIAVKRPACPNFAESACPDVHLSLQGIFQLGITDHSAIQLTSLSTIVISQQCRSVHLWPRLRPRLVPFRVSFCSPWNLDLPYTLSRVQMWMLLACGNQLGLGIFFNEFGNARVKWFFRRKGFF